jgi:hypothetical protein
MRMNPPIQVLDPLGIDIPVENDPVPLPALTTDVIYDLSKDVGKQAVVPFSGGGIQGSVQRILMHRLGVNDIRDTLGTVKPLKGREEDIPGVGLSGTRRADHHETVLDLLDLVQLKDLGDPPLSLYQAALCTNFADLFSQLAPRSTGTYSVPGNTSAKRLRSLVRDTGGLVARKMNLPGQQRDIVCHKLWYDSLSNTLDDDDLFGDCIRETTRLFRIPFCNRSRLRIPALASTAFNARRPKS